MYPPEDTGLVKRKAVEFGGNSTEEINMRWGKGGRRGGRRRRGRDGKKSQFRMFTDYLSKIMP